MNLILLKCVKLLPLLLHVARNKDASLALTPALSDSLTCFCVEWGEGNKSVMVADMGHSVHPEVQFNRPLELTSWLLSTHSTWGITSDQYIHHCHRVVLAEQIRDIYASRVHVYIYILLQYIQSCLYYCSSSFFFSWTVALKFTANGA